MLIKGSLLSPVVHPKNWDLIRVPMIRPDNGHYTVFVGDNTVRRYTDETLPDALKTKVAIILNVPFDDYIDDYELDKLSVYTNKHSPELDEVGWRVSESYFCLVLSRKILDSLLRGEQNERNEKTP